MATYKLNIARIQGCPPPAELDKALDAYGLPEDDEFGVLNHSATPQSVFGTIVRKVQQAVQRLDREAREVTAEPVEKVQVYPFGIHPKAGTLEVYAGSAAAIEQLGVFLGGSLALPTVVEAIELDLPAALDKLAQITEKFQLKSVRVSDYAHNSYMSGVYAPKFLDSEHGKEFLEEYAQFLSAASVRFATPMGRTNVHLCPTACFSYSCHEEDRPPVQSILRKLV